MDGSGKGWWQASDGRWYPPGMAHHPAARRDRTAPELAPAAAPRRSWHVWAVLIAPIAVMIALVVGVVGATSDTNSVRTDSASSNSTSTTLQASIDGSRAHVSWPVTTSTAAEPATPDTPVPTNDPGAPPPSTPTIPDPPASNPPSDTPPPTTPAAEQTTTAQPRQATPTSAEDCKAGDWVNLADDQGRSFRNQGECVSFANHQ